MCWRMACRYEIHAEPWSAREDISCSLIYAAQHSAPTGWAAQLPLFSGGQAGGGIILRPGATPIACGKAGDAGGHCGHAGWCPPIDKDEKITAETVGKHATREPAVCGLMWDPMRYSRLCVCVCLGEGGGYRVSDDEEGGGGV